ncbi:MAG: ABC transporter ATP-binding protein [Deltaproteobacteria bacterium]
MSDIVIKTENLGKKYVIGHQTERVPYLALRDVWMQNARTLWNKTKDMAKGKPVIQGDTMEEVWALKDVSFEIRRGEAVGIIGRNGAGKSTLLKLLSRITEPSTGRVSINGRVASLLEVGTGFHPELSGRENIYLNGTILGMTRKEIKRKFDEIVAFAEVEKYLDTPVKRYSSGMYVRLAFAVAAHLEPEILVVDEVLAVGDAAFQEKCIGKMGKVAKAGRTVLFVSHNMAAVEALCSRALLLEVGSVAIDHDASSVINSYLSKGDFRLSECSYDGNKEHVYFVRSHVSQDGSIPQSTISLASAICVTLEYMVPRPSRQVQIVCHLWNARDVHVMSTADVDQNSELLQVREAGLYRTKFVIPKDTLAPGNYHLSFACGIPNIQLLDEQQGPAFEVTDVGSYAAQWSGARRDVVMAIPLTWSTGRIEGI